MATTINYNSSNPRVLIIGAGLAGAEAANFLANRRVPVVLYDLKQCRHTTTGQQSGLGELICSNSLKSKELGSAHGMLKYEMKGLDSLILQAAEEFWSRRVGPWRLIGISSPS